MKEIMNRETAIISKTVFWVGIIMALSSVLYMIFNLSQADDFIIKWSVLMGIGTCFIIIGAFTSILKK